MMILLKNSSNHIFAILVNWKNNESIFKIKIFLGFNSNECVFFFFESDFNNKNFSPPKLFLTLKTIGNEYHIPITSSSRRWFSSNFLEYFIFILFFIIIQKKYNSDIFRLTLRDIFNEWHVWKICKSIFQVKISLYQEHNFFLEEIWYVNPKEMFFSFG